MLRILSNLRLPSESHLVRTFGDYPPPAAASPWAAEKERRDLADILPLIPGSEQPDALVISSPEYLPIPCDIESFPGTRILLITDWNMCLRFLPDLCKLFDFCFVDWPGYRLLRKAGIANVHHQPLFGHDPACYKVLKALDGKPGGNRNLDVSFCGNLNTGVHRDRNRLLARLAKWGAGKDIHLGQAFGEAYVDVLNRSRLVFNYSIRGEANMRVYEAMACGAVPLVEAGNQEVPILFQPDRHYFSYEPQRLEERLDALLADPARIRAVSLEAQRAVASHTKARQIESLLDFAGRDRPTRPYPSNGAEALASRKALVKMRVLGAAYTLPEALSELQARDAALPGLGAETLPAALLEFAEGIPRDTPSAANALLERLLGEPGFPAPMRALFRTRMHAARGQWQESLAWSERGLAALDGLEADPAAGADSYARFHPPIGLGKGMNTDLNQAYREDAGTGSLAGYLSLMRSHCLSARARALLSLDRAAEALEPALRIPKGRWMSLDPYLLLHDIYARQDDRARLRGLLPAWFAETPLDWTVWDRVAETLIRVGDGHGLVGFLSEILALARNLLKPDQVEAIRSRLAHERERVEGRA